MSKHHQRSEKIVIALYDSYINAIRNSIGSKIFKNYYAYVNGKKRDILRDGNLSCAVYVSSILLLFGLTDRIHTTVKDTVFSLHKYGWSKINRSRIGAILVWEAKKFPNGETHKHIGFYIGKGQAISNSSKLKSPIVHNWTYNNKRPIENIFWNRRFL